MGGVWQSVSGSIVMIPDEGTYQLHERVALVTGAAGGIGSAVCEAYQACGAQCLGVDLRCGGTVRHCDVADEDSVESAFDACERLGPITDVVHGAGGRSLGAVADVDLEEFRRVVESTSLAVFSLPGRPRAA